MVEIWIIALNAFRESVRDKVLYNIVFLGLGLVAFSNMLGDWSVFEKNKVITYFSLSIMSLSGVMLAIFVGISLVAKEIQRKTVLTLLSKPIHRAQFLLGKYLGLLLVLAVHISIMSALFFMLLKLSGGSLSLKLFGAVYLVFWELAIVVAVAILFSSFSTPVLSALFTLGVYIAGHLSGEVLKQIQFMKMMGGGGETTFNEIVAKVVHAVLPDLQRFNIYGEVVSGVNISMAFYFYTTLYALTYITIFLSIGSWWFSRKDFV